MNRQIKFRGKRTDTGMWTVGSLIPNGEKKAFIAPFKEQFHLDEVLTDTVGQFTGLLDKNGKEIYEGDIFGIPHKDGIKQHFYRIVEYCCDGFYLIDNCHEGKYGELLHREISLDGHYAGMAKTLRRFGDYCVVGNIHDNPELIKK